MGYKRLLGEICEKEVMNIVQSISNKIDSKYYKEELDYIQSIQNAKKLNRSDVLNLIGSLGIGLNACKPSQIEANFVSLLYRDFKHRKPGDYEIWF